MLGKLSDSSKGILALCFLAAVYGGVGVVTRYLNLYFPILQQLYLRLFIALILGFFLFGKKINYKKLTKISRREWFLILSRTFGTFVIASPLWVAGANIAKLANVGFIDSLPLTAAISLMLGLEKFTAKKGVLVLLSFLGVVILSVKDFGNLTSFGMGELLVLASGFFFAFRNFARIWHSKVLNDAEITQIMFALGFIMVFITSILWGEKIVVSNWSGELLFMLIIGGLIMIANIFLSNYGFGKIGPVLGNNILNMEAAFAILFGFFFYGEVLTLRELIGGILIVASVVKMNRLK